MANQELGPVIDPTTLTTPSPPTEGFTPNEADDTSQQEQHAEPSTPPVEKESKIPSFDKFLEVKGEPKSPEELKKVHEAIAKEVEKGPPTQESEPEKLVEPEVPTLPRKDEKPKRDYSGLTDEEAKLFRDMSNAAYARLYPIYKEYKDIKAKPAAEPRKDELPVAWYEHEDAFVLTPQYKDLAKSHENLSFEENYWRKQLKAIRNGDKWKPLLVDENGKYYEGAEKDPTTDDEIDVSSRLQQAGVYKQQAVAAVQGLRENFQARSKGLKTNIQQLEAKLFPFYEKPDHPHVALLKQIYEALPPEIQLNPLAGLLTKFYASMSSLGKQYTELEAKVKLNKTIAADKRAAGPNASDIGTAAPVPTKGTSITFDKFLELRRD